MITKSNLKIMNESGTGKIIDASYAIREGFKLAFDFNLTDAELDKLVSGNSITIADLFKNRSLSEVGLLLIRIEAMAKATTDLGVLAEQKQADISRLTTLNTNVEVNQTLGLGICGCIYINGQKICGCIQPPGEFSTPELRAYIE
ncbi:hypothetical protein A6770_38335 [Nostoc minutum NIES-26]|uniref:Uncharacterized protein n=1 Tax=Nostoc minutum NIES-26 TaxID=1844469 RepID=A0A367RY14_9NOSO|nr:hypothetical protein A6770_38335 [Nostoc minutum NIES-26]